MMAVGPDRIFLEHVFFGASRSQQQDAKYTTWRKAAGQAGQRGCAPHPLTFVLPLDSEVLGVGSTNFMVSRIFVHFVLSVICSMINRNICTYNLFYITICTDWILPDPHKNTQSFVVLFPRVLTRYK